ncbi:ribonuclease D [Solimonas sp. K1W22B-7]|uniref:ribonuclease D n=1 Tax=Solimonas sp. K1W22B-7 TaxID=2303331 RepID=UPI000E32E6E2|nr:ribonuclease D [Solimonas sp. K1W22B-7]AXQ30327.1 ribonuclease D [Solimonas sp. K1W22B-7]
MPTPFINTPAPLAELAQGWAGREWLAIDTEFVRVDTYNAKLCLIQVGDGRSSVCVDPLAIRELQPLLAVLAQPQTTKVLHSASQDYEIFVQLTGAAPAPLFDTQIAATLLGYGDQIGYAGLIEKLCGVTLDKSLSRTDWSRRPLSEAELAYAAADVQYLAQIYPRLREELVQAGRLAWLEEDCARLCDPERYRTAPEDAWQRLKGLARLSARDQQVAAALTAWRETEAQARNRPRKWILEDDPIYRMAERKPQTLAQLEALQVLQPKTLQRHGERLLALVTQGLAAPAEVLATDDQLEPEQKARLKALQAKLTDIAAALKLPATFIAPRADMQALLLQGEKAKVPLLQGWRRQVAGEELLKL